MVLMPLTLAGLSLAVNLAYFYAPVLAEHRRQKCFFLLPEHRNPECSRTPVVKASSIRKGRQVVSYHEVHNTPENKTMRNRAARRSPGKKERATENRKTARDRA